MLFIKSYLFLDKLSYVDMHIMCNMRQKNTRYIKILDIKQARLYIFVGVNYYVCHLRLHKNY